MQVANAADGPRSAVSSQQLRDLGLGDLVIGDLNRDGWLDERDIAAFLSGQRPGSLFDLNQDAIIDMADFADLETCLSGADIPATLACRERNDADGDADVDVADFAVFQTVFTAPDGP